MAARHIAAVVLPAEAGFASVVLRNCDTQKSSILKVILGSDSRAHAVVLHPRGDAFYLITTGQPRSAYDEETGYQKTRIEALKFNFQGEMMFKRECWAKYRSILDRNNWSFDPTVNGSHYTIALESKYQVGCIEKASVFQDLYIDYDMESEKMSYEKIFRRVCELGSGSGQPRIREPFPRNMRWKDSTYFAWYEGRRLGSILVQDVNDSWSARKTEILDIDTFANAEKRAARIMQHGNGEDDYWLVGDEKFLVLVKLDEVQVWCFEKGLVMPGEEPDYRAERMRRADMRAAKRRLHAMET